MRRRLLVVSMSLVGVLLLALMAPLVTTFAADRTQDLFVQRLSDVTRFAVLAEGALEDAEMDPLDVDLERYVEVYGGSVVVLNANREVVASAGSVVAVNEGPAQDVVTRALTGAGSDPPRTAWPWTAGEMVIGSPVGRDAQVLGAVVMVAPTDPVRTGVAWMLVALVLGGVATMLATAYGVIAPFVGWILRPVHDLDDAARRLAEGDLASRAHETGPPELQELARSFNAMADNVEVSQAQQRDLVADAAHQLGNPLTALRLRVENLGAAGADPDGVHTALDETDRLSTIVEALLRLSQVGAARAEVTVVDVAAQARHRCELWAPSLPGLRLSAPGSAPALGTADLVDVVLDALLDNAAKFAVDAPVEVRVAPTGRGAEDGVVLRVRDGGPGLEDDDLAKVGARFFRGRRHQNVPGTGLGLAIVRARLEEVGGSLVVTRPEGGGFQAEIVLPAATGGAPGSTGPHPGGAPAAT